MQELAIASWAARDQPRAGASCAWRTASILVSPIYGRRSPIPAVSAAGSARWRATCDSAVSSARTSSLADGPRSGMSPEGREVALRRWLDDFGDDPAVLADLAVEDEAQ